MNQHQFHRRVEKSKIILRDSTLLKNSSFMHKKLQNDCHKLESIKKYAQIYQRERDGYNYNFLLTDDSIIQLQYNPEGEICKEFEDIEDNIGLEFDNLNFILKYCYFESPYTAEYYSYMDYLIDNELNYEDVKLDLWEEYNEGMEKLLKNDVTYIRYDYSLKGYKEGCHSISHFHMGLSDSNRFTSDKIVTPEGFIIFLLKQIYYHKVWKDKINPDMESTLKTYFESYKPDCLAVTPLRFKGLDKYELYFT